MAHPRDVRSRGVCPYCGTVITAIVANPISSSTAKVGDTFAIESQSDVVVYGWDAISRGAPGQGSITSVDHAGSHGHPGGLGIEMNRIYAVDGEKVRLTSQNVDEEGESKVGVSSTVTIIWWATLGSADIFAHNFVKGRDVTVNDTHPLKKHVDDSVYVVANIFTPVKRRRSKPAIRPSETGQERRVL